MDARRDNDISITVDDDHTHITVGREIDVSKEGIEQVIEQLRTELLQEAERRQEVAKRRALAARLVDKASFAPTGEPICVGEPLRVDEYHRSETKDRRATLAPGARVTKLADDGTTALVRYTLDSFLMAHATGGRMCTPGAKFLLPLATLAKWQRRHEEEHRTHWDCRGDEPEDD